MMEWDLELEGTRWVLTHYHMLNRKPHSYRCYLIKTPDCWCGAKPPNSILKWYHMMNPGLE